MEDKFSVWVGSLSMNVKEETLLDYFGKFGPLKSVVIIRDELGKSRQYGFVNYHSLEEAESAASVMDGCKLLGQAIKTRGPSEVEKSKNEQKETKDYRMRMFTDCLLYVDGRDCTWKFGQCPFRHCEYVKQTEIVCERWLERRCEDLKCKFRHPRLIKAQNILDNAITRCPSHNAFKCFGECGNKDCNTHFLEHTAYLEHVRMETKKLAQPVDVCGKCQAVFFSQAEKINHRCYKHILNPPRFSTIPQFTSTRMQAEKDIAHPNPVYPIRTHSAPNATNQAHLIFDKKSLSFGEKNGGISSPILPKQAGSCNSVQKACNADDSERSSNQSIHNCNSMSVNFGSKSSITNRESGVNNFNSINTASINQPSNASNYVNILPAKHPMNSVNARVATEQSQVHGINFMNTARQGNTTNFMNTARQGDSTNFINIAKQGNSTNFMSTARQGNVTNFISSSNQTKFTSTYSTSHEKTSNELEPVGVFWDFENCSIPKGKSAQAVVQKIRRVFFKERREVEFMCVCDTSKEKKCVIEELNKAQVTVVHINATSKNAVDDKLRQSLRRFAQTYSRPATVILISGDGNFAMDLSDLRHRHNFQVVCLHNAAASTALLSFAHEAHRFDLFTEELQTSTQSLHKPSFSNDVLVTNLPTTKSASTLKSRLSKLSDNCGGKVVVVEGNKAIIRFPSTEAAFRARRRLDKEDFSGFILRATLLPYKECGDVAKRKRKEGPKNGYSPASGVKPLMDVTLNDRDKSWKENQSPNINPTRNYPNGNSPHFSEPPAIVNTQFPGQQFSGFPRQVIFNNMVYPAMYHNMFGVGVPANSPIPRPPSPLLSPSSPLTTAVNGLIQRPPSPEQLFNGVDLLVTNINESFSKAEIKKKLASVFREHCKVYSVALHAKNGAPLRAFVKVPKLTDAHLAISKLNGKVVLGQTVHVSLASERDKELCYLQDEAISVLQDAPLSWLPLDKFFTNFEKKYRRRLDVRHLDEIQDFIVVNGSVGCQTITLLEGKLDSELVTVDNKTFSSDVCRLLNHYDGVIALVNFPALYWLEFHKEIKLSSTGTLLEELLRRVPNVTVAESAAKRCIQWVKKSAVNSCDFTDLSYRLVELLQKDHEFEMTFERLQERFLSLYGKELDSLSYGFQSLSDLFHSLSSVVQVKDGTLECCVCLCAEYRVKLFKKELKELLQHQPQQCVLLSNFMASYVKHFGQKFKLASFGFNRLTDLIKASSSIAEIEGVGDQRIVTLAHKKDEIPTLQRQFDELTCEIQGQLNDSEEINVKCVIDIYSKRRGQPFSLAHYGCTTLDELLTRLSNSFQVVTRDNENFLRLYRNSVEDLKEDVVSIVDRQESKLVYVRNIFKLYEKMFHRKFPYELSLLNEALKNIGKPLEVRGNGIDQVVGIFNDEDTHGDFDLVRVKTAVEILYQSAEYSLPKLCFQSLYERNILKMKNVVKDDAKLTRLPSCVVVRREGDVESIELRHSYRMRILVEELKQLMALTDDLSLSMDDLPTRYEKYFEKKFNLERHGLLCLDDLKVKLNGFLEMTSQGKVQQNDRISLTLFSRFELETQRLLDGSGGCMSLSRFAPIYQQMFSKPCIVSDYGYTKLSTLINAFPHVAKIIGSGPEKAVISVQKSIPERVCSDMLSVRIIGGSNEEISVISKESTMKPSSVSNCDKSSPAGQETTEKAKSNVSGKNERSRAAKVRLAANFMFPRKEKK